MKLAVAKLVQKIIRPLARWSMKRMQKSNKSKKEVEQEEKRREFYNHIQQLYRFVQWLNKSFPNRRVRKAFWSNVSQGTPAVETAMENLLEKYKKKEEK